MFGFFHLFFDSVCVVLMLASFSSPVSCTVFCLFVRSLVVSPFVHSHCARPYTKNTELIKQWLTTNKMTSALVCLVVKSHIFNRAFVAYEILSLLVLSFVLCSSTPNVVWWRCCVCACVCSMFNATHLLWCYVELKRFVTYSIVSCDWLCRMSQ